MFLKNVGNLLFLHREASVKKKLGKVKSEVETVDDIKKELEEYKEDVENLQAVKEIVQRSGLKESKGAQRLFAKVNKMLRTPGDLEPFQA